MKAIFVLALLMSAFCLAECSKVEPQSEQNGLQSNIFKCVQGVFSLFKQAAAVYRMLFQTEVDLAALIQAVYALLVQAPKVYGYCFA